MIDPVALINPDKSELYFFSELIDLSRWAACDWEQSFRYSEDCQCLLESFLILSLFIYLFQLTGRALLQG